MHSKMARRACSHGQTPNSGQPTGKNPEKTKMGILGKKKAREMSPRFNLQRRNRGETIKKQLLHLNEYGLSRPHP